MLIELLFLNFGVPVVWRRKVRRGFTKVEVSGAQILKGHVNRNRGSFARLPISDLSEHVCLNDQRAAKSHRAPRDHSGT